MGGAAPIAIQSMTNTKTTDTKATLSQIEALFNAGCELVRVAVPNIEAARALGDIVKISPLPVIADIHFDADLAILAIEEGAAKVRVNPGNLGGPEKLIQIAKKAQAFKVPLRVGVNAGSLDQKIAKKYGGLNPEALSASALSYCEILEKAGFNDIVVSLKSSDVMTTIYANRAFAAKASYPLHLGVTEAGPAYQGVVKNAAGLGALLAEGLGDTLRVSLTAPPVEEVRAARAILQALNTRVFGPQIVSCPTCGRCAVDLLSLVTQVEELLEGSKLPIKIAVMGCAVNGPGEAREADLGLAAGKKTGLIFKKGTVIKTVPAEDLLAAFKEELAKFIQEQEKQL